MRVLKKLGFHLRPGNPGKRHEIYTRDGHPTPVAVPRHTGDLPTPTVKSIWRQAGITEQDAQQAK